MLSVFVLKLSAQVTDRGTMPQFYMLSYASYTILATQRGGAWHHGPSKYAPGPVNIKIQTRFENIV